PRNLRQTAAAPDLRMRALRRHHDGPGISDDQRPGPQRAARRPGQSPHEIARARKIRPRKGGGALLDRADSFADRKGIEQSCDPVGKIKRQASIAGGPDLGIVELEGICVAKMKPQMDTNSTS